jgi:8-oxo-dGTP diphosphatase
MQLGVLCYIFENDKTLLLHRNKKNDQMQDYWIGLGGHIETSQGEAPHEAVVREVYEESELIVKPKLRGVAVFRHIEESEDDWYAYIYSTDTCQGKLKTSSEGTVKWIENTKLESLNIPEGDRLFLRWMNETNQLFSAKFVYKEKKLIEHAVEFY